MPIPQQRFHISKKGTHRRDGCAPGLAAAFLLLGLQSAPSGDILRGGAAAPNVTNRTSGQPRALGHATRGLLIPVGMTVITLPGDHHVATASDCWMLRHTHGGDSLSASIA